MSEATPIVSLVNAATRYHVAWLTARTGPLFWLCSEDYRRYKANTPMLVPRPPGGAA